jgi:trehalose/maltose hydrolase-like predicted phosphorylase
MGPDEFHEKYPDTDKAGLKNNAYTNVMVAWLLDKALLVLEQLLPEARREEMMNRLHLSKQELDRWEHITFRMTVPFLTESPGIIAQFDGWEDLQVRHLIEVSATRA